MHKFENCKSGKHMESSVKFAIRELNKIFKNANKCARRVAVGRLKIGCKKIVQL